MTNKNPREPHLEAVNAVDMFQGLDEERRLALAEACELRSLPKDGHVFHAGDPGRGFYALISGRVRIYTASPGGKEQVLHFIAPGDAFGEVAVFKGGDFPAHAQAMEDSEVLFLARDRFLELARSDPELTLQMLAQLSLRLRQFVRQVAELSLKEVPARLAAHLLKKLWEQGGDAVVLDTTKGQLAAYLGTIQETLSRALKRLERDGLIAVRGRDIQILDQEGLKKRGPQGALNKKRARNRKKHTSALFFFAFMGIFLLLMSIIRHDRPLEAPCDMSRSP